MTNTELLEKSVADMSRADLYDAAVKAKNLLTIVLKTMNDEQRKEVLGSHGVSIIETVLKPH